MASQFYADEINEGLPLNPFRTGWSFDAFPSETGELGSSASLWLIEAQGVSYAVKVMRHSDRSSSEQARRVYERCIQLAHDEYERMKRMGGARGHAPRVWAFGMLRTLDDKTGVVMNRPAFVMDYVSGIGLDQLRETMLAKQGGAVSSEDVLSVGKMLVEALLCCAVRSKEDDRYLTTVSHRDLSSNNIVFVEDSEGRTSRAVVIDFGQSAENDDPNVTNAGVQERSSTPYIGSPELFVQNDESTARSRRNTSYTDVYAVGCILYYLKTGHWPYERQIEQVCRDAFERKGYLDSEARQKLFEVKNAGAVELTLVGEGETGKLLSSVIRRCTEPGVNKLGGRYDIARLGEALGLSEDDVIGRASSSAMGLAETTPDLIEEADATIGFPAAREGSLETSTAFSETKNAPVIKGSSVCSDTLPVPPSEKEERAKARTRKEKPAQKKSFPMKAVLIAILIAIVAVAGFVFAVGSFGKAPSTKGVPVEEHLKLKYSGNDLKNDAQLLEQRAKKISEHCTVVASDDGVDVSFPAGFGIFSSDGSNLPGGSLTSVNDRYDALEFLLAEPLALYAGSASATAFSEGSCVPIKKEDIASVELVDAPMEGVNLSSDFANVEKRGYFIITLTDEAFGRLNEKSAAWPQGVAFSLGLGADTSKGVTQSMGGKTFKVMFDVKKDENALLLEAFESGGYKGAFESEGYLTDVAWEDPVQGKGQLGGNQSSNSLFSGAESVVVTLRGTKPSLVSKDVMAFKQRLDSLGVEYSFGMGPKDKEVSFRMKTGRVDKSIASVLAGDTASAYICADEEHYVSLSGFVVSVANVGGNKLQLLLSANISSSEEGRLSDLVDRAKKNDDGKIYLKANGPKGDVVAIARADGFDVKHLAFEESPFVKGALTESNRWAFDLVKAYFETKLEDGYNITCCRIERGPDSGPFGALLRQEPNYPVVSGA